MHAFFDSTDHVTLDSLTERFEKVRTNTRRIFSLLSEDAFDQRPIPLRHPIRFYEGHLAAFNLNTFELTGRLSSKPDANLCTLFARGIDPDDKAQAAEQSIHDWPTRERVARFTADADEIMKLAMASGTEHAVALTCIEHEEMHQETLFYLIHQLAEQYKQAPERYSPQLDSTAPAWRWIGVEAGEAVLGADRQAAGFGWDNEFDRHTATTGGFQIQATKATNADFLRFVEAGGYHEPSYWSEAGWRSIRKSGRDAPPFWVRRDAGWRYRGLFEEHALPAAWPAVVSYDEAAAFCEWKGVRLPTEAEWTRAVQAGQCGDEPELYAGDGLSFHPVDAEGAPRLANGLVEPFGNGWEWTRTVFGPFPGFKPAPYYPGYSADFFDAKHYVLKGAAPVTPKEMIRPSFRNWFYHDYPYAYTTFRCVTNT